MNKSMFKSKFKVQNLIKSYFLALLPVWAFGVYKNLILPLNEGIAFRHLVLNLFYPILGFGLGVIFDYLINRKLEIRFNALSGWIIGMAVFWNTKLWLFGIILGLTMALNSIFKKNNWNLISFCLLLIIGFSSLQGKVSFANCLEVQSSYSYNFWERFFGYQIGGLFITSLFLILAGYVILSFNKIYQKEIALVSIFSYLSCFLIFFIGTSNYQVVLDYIFQANNYFSFIFIAPFTIYSPYSPLQTRIFSLVVGVISAIIFWFWKIPYSALIAILIGNLICLILDWIKVYYFKKSKVAMSNPKKI